jgi:hypothetical protein
MPAGAPQAAVSPDYEALSYVWGKQNTLALLYAYIFRFCLLGVYTTSLYACDPQNKLGSLGKTTSA